MSDRVLRVTAAAATLAAIALLCTVAAWWAWQAFGPRPVHIVPAPPADPAATLLASGLWSSPGAAPSAPAPAKDDVATLSGDTRLLGIVSEPDGKGYALFRLPSGPRLVAAGQDIAQGARLVAVRPDGITIRDGGGERRIALRGEPPPKATAPATGTTVARAPTRNPACVPPTGFKGTVLRLNAEFESPLSVSVELVESGEHGVRRRESRIEAGTSYLPVPLQPGTQSLFVVYRVHTNGALGTETVQVRPTEWRRHRFSVD